MVTAGKYRRKVLFAHETTDFDNPVYRVLGGKQPTPAPTPRPTLEPTPAPTPDPSLRSVTPQEINELQRLNNKELDQVVQVSSKKPSRGVQKRTVSDSDTEGTGKVDATAVCQRLYELLGTPNRLAKQIAFWPNDLATKRGTRDYEDILAALQYAFTRSVLEKTS